MSWRIEMTRRLEESFRDAGVIKLVKDGSQPTEKDQSTEPTFYTRIYQVVLDGKLANMRMKFVYNIRDGWADFGFLYGMASSRTLDSTEAAKVMSEFARHSTPGEVAGGQGQ